MSDLGNKEIFSKNLRYYMEQNSIDRNQICEKLNFKYSTFSDWCNGKKYPRIDKIEMLANYFGIEKSDLIENHNIYKINRKVIKIPVVGTVAAGEPILAEQNIIDYEKLPADKFKDGDYVGLKVKGDSMAPRILEDDIVIVRQQEEAKTGQIAVVLIGDEATIKQIKKTESGLMLIPYNTSKYEPMFFTKAEIEQKSVKIIGIVVRLIGYNF